MIEPNAMADVRAAKERLDAQTPTFADLADRLRVIEHEYRSRTGQFTSVPTTRPAAVQAMIDCARDHTR